MFARRLKRVSDFYVTTLANCSRIVRELRGNNHDDKHIARAMRPGRITAKFLVTPQRSAAWRRKLNVSVDQEYFTRS